jgi:hypothetical protein
MRVRSGAADDPKVRILAIKNDHESSDTAAFASSFAK